MIKRGTWRVAGFVALAVLILAGCGSRWLAGGKLHFDQGRYERALETFQLAVEEQPESGEAHLWLGRAYAELERDSMAVAQIRKAAELDPMQSEMAHNTLESYWSRRFNSGLGFAKDGAEARQMGNEERAQERLEQAVERFERAILFAPDSVKNYSNLGKVLYQLGRTDQAMEEFDRAREMGGGRADLQQFLINVYLFLGDQAMQQADAAGYQRAIEMFQEALTFDLGDEEKELLHFNTGVAYASLAEADATPESEKAAHYRDALQHYLAVLEIDPRDEATLENAASAYAALEEYEQAIEMAQRLLDIQPWNPHYYLVIARMNNAAGDRESFAGYMVIRSILSSGSPAPKGDIRGRASDFGPRNDMLVTLLERGEPEMVYEYSGSRGTYDIWCYWTEGRIYIFKQGSEEFRAAFEGLTAEQIQEAFGDQP
ncbi:MAG: tetratricopeptide repeat protein [Candidatus Eisenbacteria bacterium]|nr:tetratricopeptide repeat protein [Candidatus Eisenbacteria bacterium]